MRALSELSATFILAIPLSEPERLFTGAKDQAKAEYRELIKQWHPDRTASAEAMDVAAHINRLYDTALIKIEAGSWHAPGHLLLKGTDGKTRRIRYRKKHAFELGEMFYGDTAIIWLVRIEYADLFENARRMIDGLHYRDQAMKAEIARYMPQVRTVFETIDGFAMVLNKTPDTFLLRDILDALNGKIDAKHVAWMQSSIHNIACYLDYAGLTHNAISPDTMFVSPKYHSCSLLGGWWYSAKAGSRLNALPPPAHAIAPPDVLKAKRADPKLDLTLIRAMGRELLGDRSGMTLIESKAAPRPMIDFLRQPTTGLAQRDYALWRDPTLTKSFGARRFVELAISPSDIFKD